MSVYAMLGMYLLSDLIYKKNQDTLKEGYTNVQEKHRCKISYHDTSISVGVFFIVQILF